MGIDSDELTTIIIPEIYKKLYIELTTANRGGEAEILNALKRWHYNYENEDNFEEEPERVLVVGKSHAEEKYLVRKIEKLGLNPDNFDFCLKYKNGMDFSKLKNSTKYSDVIVGEMGHKQKGDAKANSMIDEMIAHPECYPNTVKCVTSGNHLKLTEQSFQDALLKTKVYGRLRAFANDPSEISWE